MDGFGCATGWLSTALPLLESDATPLETGKLTVAEMSWIGSVVALGAIVGNCLCGHIISIIGTKHTIFLIGFPQLVSNFLQILRSPCIRIMKLFQLDNFRLVGCF